MITAVDTSILFDVLEPDPVFGARSRDALRRCEQDGRLVACEIVWAEVAGGAPPGREPAAPLRRLAIGFSVVEEETALLAGELWKRHRARGGSRTGRLVADFLVGAHALRQADRLLTRDRGFYRDYFSKLEVLDPTAR